MVTKVTLSGTPRSTICTSGPQGLSDDELVSLIIGAPLPPGAWAALTAGAAGLSRLGELPVAEVAERAGLSAARAARLLAAIELGRRTLRRPLSHGEPISSVAAVLERLEAPLVGLEEEELHVLALDNRSRLLGHFIAARGGANQVYVSPKDLFRRLVRLGATSAIVAHNHPSGDPTPSEADTELTSRLAEAGRILGVALVDHVVIARGGSYSYAEENPIALLAPVEAVNGRGARHRPRRRGHPAGARAGTAERLRVSAADQEP
jgi:DNA repair protein RadC